MSRYDEHHPVPVRRAYDRERDLARLVAMWPAELADRSISGRLRLLARLRRELRRERQRGLAGHWCYDLARHSGLLAAYREEVAELLGQQKAAGPPAGPRGEPLSLIR